MSEPLSIGSVVADTYRISFELGAGHVAPQPRERYARLVVIFSLRFFFA